MRRILLMGLLAVMGCGSSPTLPNETRQVSDSALLLATVSYQGACLTPGGYPARCDVTFYRDYDLGGPQTFYNVSTWTMTAPVDLTKNKADFKFKARYRFPAAPWSQTIAFKYVPSTAGTVFLWAAGPILPGAPTVARLPYTLIP